MQRPSIDPGRWRPPKAPPFVGVLETNTRLTVVERWAIPEGRGGEDVALDHDGRLYTGVEDGRILRYPRGGGPPEVVADTDGRPLGIEVDRDGTLVVCDPRRGLLRVDPANGEVRVLVDRYDDAPFQMVNNASITSDGRIYFTDSTRFDFDWWTADLYEHRGNGRLFVHDPASGNTRAVVDRLYFANGVAVAPDDAYVLVAESTRYRISRLWLRGERAGQIDTFADNLPGFPDNLAATDDGRFWVAIFQPRDWRLDALLPRPHLRQAVWALPGTLRPTPNHYGLVVCLDGRGRILDCLHDPSGEVAPVTGVREHGGWLYVGSLDAPFVARVSIDHRSAQRRPARHRPTQGD